MSDTPKTLAAILAEMRDPCAPRAPSLPALADRIETAVQRFVADDCAKCAHYNAATISLKDALDLANTIANHGTNANGLGDKASATIYALCHEVRTVRGEDANIKQEVQKLRRELRDIRRATGNAAAMREALEAFVESVEWLCDGDESGRLKRQFGVLLSDARAALAAPARNCDRFATEDEARRAFEEEHSREIVHNLYTAAFDWLFEKMEGGEE